MCKLGVICQERLRREVKISLSANIKSYIMRNMPRQLAQRMTLGGREWSFHGLSTVKLTLFALRIISAVAELLVRPPDIIVGEVIFYHGFFLFFSFFLPREHMRGRSWES